jgi:hypothetical protein
MTDSKHNSDGEDPREGAAGTRGAGPRFKAHSSYSRPSDGTVATGSSAYQGGEYLTEEDWHARRRPEPIEDIVGRVMARVSGGRAAPAALLSARWGEVVGETFADKTRPGSCESGRLVILVVDGATASKMRFATSQIMQKAVEVAGAGSVSSISFRVSPGLRQ